MFSDKVKQSNPLALPDSGRTIRGHDYLVAVMVAGHGPQKVAWCRVMEGLKLLTVVAAHITLLPPRCPSLARKRGAAVRSLLHSHIVIPTVQHALGVAWGAHTVHRPGQERIIRWLRLFLPTWHTVCWPAGPAGPPCRGSRLGSCSTPAWTIRRNAPSSRTSQREGMLHTHPRTAAAH